MTSPEFDFSQDGYSDIPSEIAMEGWKETPIKESSHPLVLLNGLDEKIQVRPMYYILGIAGTSDAMYLRSGASERLIEATKSLPTGYSFVVFDAYRPISVQTEIFIAQRRIFKNMYPELDEDSITKMTETYVSLPSTDPKKPSPHSTGGAIDLSICDNNGKLLDMGTEWDSFDIRSRSSYFRGVSDVSHNNRKLLYQALERVGFTNYPEEWWHYDFGNQFWGHILKKEAIYGLIEGGDIYDRNR
ncbi:MAG TPA: M15 family metallopeptidase [Candidatus Sulfotelmatobacter sp.]|nr:M15 family metallopeptidase [Candidatus Sulfotelmatobacter sp.]